MAIPEHTGEAFKKHIAVLSGWYLCPECRQKLCKKSDDAHSGGVFIKCKNCRKEVEIKIGE